MCEKCVFCNAQTVYQEGYFLCECCKTICFTKGLPDEEIYRKITDGLQKIQDKILGNQDKWHALEQKYCNGEQLSEKEEIIRNNLVYFQQLQRDLKLGISTKQSLGDKSIRKLLYKLLKLTIELNN